MPVEPLGQYPDPTHVVAHLSDPHLLAGSLQYDAIDTVARLEAALERLARVGEVAREHEGLRRPRSVPRWCG